MIKYSIAQRYDARFVKNEANRAEIKYTFNDCPLEYGVHMRRVLINFKLRLLLITTNL